MTDRSFEYIEECIDQIDELYYWAKSYCRDNQCTVKRFYEDNKEEVLQQLARHGY